MSVWHSLESAFVLHSFKAQNGIGIPVKINSKNLSLDSFLIGIVTVMERGNWEEIVGNNKVMGFMKFL